MTRIDQLLSQLSQDELEALKFDWSIWARKSQLPPTGDWTTWLLLGGRGAGKTRAGAEWVRANATGAMAKSPIALVGETISDARAVMVEGHSGIMAIHPTDERPTFNRSRNELEWSNGAVARLYSASDPESLRGPQFATAWCDETCKWPHADAAWDMLQFCMRIGERPQQLVTTTPKPIKLLKRIMDDPLTRVTNVKTAENRHNLAPSFLSSIVGQYRGTSLGRQELDGEILQSAEDALWTRQLIDQNRANCAPELERIVIAVDPPVSSHEKSDKCGIVVAGLFEGCVYILADATIPKASPLKWATKVADLFEHFEADCVVAEVNQGGDLVSNALHQVDPTLPVKSVHARRGKWLRAEPVALLYERGSVRHVGLLADQIREPSAARYLSEFYVAKLTAGAGTAYENAQAGGSNYRLCSYDRIGGNKQTLSAYIYVLAGTALVSASNHQVWLNGAELEDFKQIQAADGWQHINAMSDVSMRYASHQDNELLPLFATSGVEVLLALPAIIPDSIRVGPDDGFIPSIGLAS